MVTCLKTHGMFLLVESGIKQSCYSNYFSSMLVFSALKIPEISKPWGMLTFWAIWVPRNTISNVISEQSLMCVCFCQGFKEKRPPLRPQVVWMHLRGLPFNYQRRFSGCLQERSGHKMTLTYHKNGTASCCIWAFVLITKECSLFAQWCIV